MAILSREELTFAQLVGQYFLALKGRGLVLSATDLALVRQWEAQGAPPWVVCEGIKAAFEAHRSKHGPDARPPATLTFCRRAVKKALKAWQEANVGRG